MSTLTSDEIRIAVRQNYAAKVTQGSSCCGGGASSSAEISLGLGYNETDLADIPEGANLGLGCGNPTAIAQLKPGETVLDLGSGGGFDCFLAARKVGDTGQVIGVDMTPAMISQARRLANEQSLSNVQFRLGEIEYLPVGDNSVDVIISNCVINLSPEKSQVFRDAFRVLKPGGRLAVADVVATAPLPESVRQNLEFYSSCISGAAEIADLEAMLRAAGFEKVQIVGKTNSKEIVHDWAPDNNPEDYLLSANIEAYKPVVAGQA